MDTTYIVAAGGVVGFVALTLLMGAALSSLADLLAVLPARGWPEGSQGKADGRDKEH